jgi:hypothetical protein
LKTLIETLKQNTKQKKLKKELLIENISYSTLFLIML